MRTLIISTEGTSEEQFVKEALRPYLNEIFYAEAINLGTGRGRNGGWNTFGQIESEINTLLHNPYYIKKYRNALVTTMYDFSDIRDDFPDYQKIILEHDKYVSVGYAESVLQGRFPKDKFVPYFQLHQFESLVFSDPAILLYEYPDKQAAVTELKRQRSNCKDGNPELINSTDKPSYRIAKAINRNTGAFKGNTIGIWFR